MIWVKCSVPKKTNRDVKSKEKQIAMSIETSVELNKKGGADQYER